jgi:hypothetical protein
LDDTTKRDIPLRILVVIIIGLIIVISVVTYVVVTYQAGNTGKTSRSTCTISSPPGKIIECAPSANSSTTSTYSTSLTLIGTTYVNGTTAKYSTSYKDIGAIDVNGSAQFEGTNLTGTLSVDYPIASQSGNSSAPITSSGLKFDCNNSLFSINADGRVILNITIIGTGNTIFIEDSAGLNLIFDGNSNKLTVTPQDVPVYSELVNGSSDQIDEEPLPL